MFEKGGIRVPLDRRWRKVVGSPYCRPFLVVVHTRIVSVVVPIKLKPPANDAGAA